VFSLFYSAVLLLSFLYILVMFFFLYSVVLLLSFPYILVVFTFSTVLFCCSLSSTFYHCSSAVLLRNLLLHASFFQYASHALHVLILHQSTQ
jgi:hypothetical protein